MPDKIQLLSDHIANQIAAGEVIQRPASAVKELLENAVDAGATEIKLIIEDAGKQRVQVIDNGCGMSAADARMCFERHATSKINQIDDLFHIHTMGFRGEALASIAAVAQVELKSRKPEEELGTYIEIAGSRIIKEEPCACPAGTSIAMKNLFFSVPARRNFLKSNPTEMRHIIDAFTQVALAFPHIGFILESKGQELFHLPSGKLKQRIVHLLGNNYESKLVAVNESTDYMNMKGFVGKPETAKKTRGDQFLFVNNRYIRSGYLNHAIAGAFSALIPTDHFPLYVLFIDLDAARIDINVHPTKQEIKFEDEKIIYAFVQSAVKHALAHFSITPALDFDLNGSIQQLPSISKPFTEEQKEQTARQPLYQGFTQKHQAHSLGNEHNRQHWQSFYEQQQAHLVSDIPAIEPADAVAGEAALAVPRTPRQPQQIHERYILQQIKSGFILIDQQAAHERVLYERYRSASEKQPLAAQQSLFPETLELSAADATQLLELLPALKTLGYDLQQIGRQAFAIQGTPADVTDHNEKECLEHLLEQYKQSSTDLKIDPREKMIRSLARQHAIKAGKTMSPEEMQHLIDLLFACEQAQVAPSGRYTFISFRMDELDRLFGK